MAVVGIDFGNLASKVCLSTGGFIFTATNCSQIGVARHRGIDIITNEVSNRATPCVLFRCVTIFGSFSCRTLVSFGPKQRSIGESAKTQETSNFKNTVGSLKRLIGRTASDPEVLENEKKFINATLVDANGTVGVKVSFRYFLDYSS